MNKRAAFPILLFILVLGAFFRFYLLTKIPLGLYPDEAMNGNNALEAIATRAFKIFYPENNGREGLFINLQALSLWLFGKEPWALRLVSAIFGTLTIGGIYLLTRELFPNKNPDFKAQGSKQIIDSHDKNAKKFRRWVGGFWLARGEVIALLSSFFLASSFWHINFSRIGFRAITVPFFATYGLYFLLKGLRRGKIFDLVYAGIFVGLGFYTYIAFRFMPFVIALPLLWYLRQWLKHDPNIQMAPELSASSQMAPELFQASQTPSQHPLHLGDKFKSFGSLSCAPCAILLFLFVTFITALPIGWYFLQNPHDFFGRATEVSIFSAESPFREFIISNFKTLGMFFVPGGGDCNQRHNINCQPFLGIGILGFIGALSLWQKGGRKEFIFLLVWIFFMSLPATLTREGLPHALRSIGMIPPLTILEGYGAWSLGALVFTWLEKQKIKWPESIKQLERIKKESAILAILLLAAFPLNTYWQYFVRWANSPRTYFAFSTDIWHLGQFLNNQPPEIRKYVVVNLPGVDIRGIPAPAQTVMFATNTFRDEDKVKKNISYIRPEDINDRLIVIAKQKTITAFLNGDDRSLIRLLQKRFPQLKVTAPSDFVILQN